MGKATLFALPDRAGQTNDWMAGRHFPRRALLSAHQLRILSEAGVAVPNGIAADTPQAAADAFARLGGQPAVVKERKVLIGFTLSDLYAEPFTFKTGERAGEVGVSLKARLLRISWAKVDGGPVYRAADEAA